MLTGQTHRMMAFLMAAFAFNSCTEDTSQQGSGAVTGQTSTGQASQSSDTVDVLSLSGPTESGQIYAGIPIPRQARLESEHGADGFFTLRMGEDEAAAFWETKGYSVTRHSEGFSVLMPNGQGMIQVLKNKRRSLDMMVISQLAEPTETVVDRPDTPPPADSEHVRLIRERLESGNPDIGDLLPPPDER